MHMPSIFSSPSPLDKLESKIVKEGKAEDSNVKHTLKDLATLERDSEKAHKDLVKAQHTLSKRQKEDVKATEALNKASTAREVATVNLADAEKDLKLKQEREAQLHADLAAKRTEVDGVVSAQKEHNEAREAKLAEIHHERETTATRKASADTQAVDHAPVTSNAASTEAVPAASPVEEGAPAAVAAAT